MNNDLISREALKNHIIDIFDEEVNYDKKWAMGLKYSLKLIDAAPTVEPDITNEDLDACMTESYHLGYELAEVNFKKPQVDCGEWGKWIITEIRCPSCLEYFQPYRYSTEELKKCPNCGEEMRKGVTE